MCSKPTKPKPKTSPPSKQCSMETFIHSSATDNCILITDTPDKVKNNNSKYNNNNTTNNNNNNNNNTSPKHAQVQMSPQLVLTPISLLSSPSSSKEELVLLESKSTPGHSKTEELSLSLDALAIARKGKSLDTNQSPDIASPVENPLSTPPNATTAAREGGKMEGGSGKKQRKPRTKNEMEVEWGKLKEERKEVASLKKEYEKKISELSREKEKLSKQIERNEEREKEKELRAQERDAKLKRREEMMELKHRERELRIKLKETQLQDRENDRARTEEERSKKRDKEVAEQQRFKSFFIPKPLSSRRQQETVYQLDSRFVPFHIKDGMKLASLPIKQIDHEEFDMFLSLDPNEFPPKLLLERLKCGRQLDTSRRSEAMESDSVADTDIMIVAEGDGGKSCARPQPIKVRFKLLQFVENRRPAYFGTFFKRSSLVTGRRPYGRDITVLDYEVDSDEEWEPEDPDADSIKSNDSDEEGSASQNDSDSEDGFFVPHGYLSEDEGHDSDNEGDDDDDHDLVRDPLDCFEEKRKRKLQAKQEAWLSEISQKCQPLKPFIISRLANSHISVENLAKIEKCTGVLLVEDPLEVSVPPDETSTLSNRSKEATRIVNRTALPYFVQYIHELSIGVDRATIQFSQYWNEHFLPAHFPDRQPDDLVSLKVSKRRLVKTIHCIANKVEQGFQKVWVVKEEYLCPDALEVDIKQEIRNLFPAKISNKQPDNGNSKATNVPKSDVITLDSSSPIQNTKPVEKYNEITKFTSPIMRLQFPLDERQKSSPVSNYKTVPTSVMKLTKIPSPITNVNTQTSLKHTKTATPLTVSNTQASIKITKISPTLTKPNVQMLQNDVNKSESVFKRKSLSEMRAMVTKPCPETPLSPPDIEMSDIKRVKLSNSDSNLNTELVEPPPREPRRRLVLGAPQVDSKGSIIHVWK